ncbi:MAG: nitroreductase family protein [Oscillospiraceae bacterium]|nr:nitroreductase family protein [Oscillospiraceae bacterium]
MDFCELARERYSVRKFDSRPIEDEKLQKVLETGLIAPTAKNYQPFSIYVIRSEDAMAKIKEVTNCSYGAPIVLMFTYDLAEEWLNPLDPSCTSGQQDTSIVATHVMLQAAELGLGTCWVNMFDPTLAAELFDIPETEIPLLLMPIGYAAEDAAPSVNHTTKRPAEELVFYL